MNDLNFTSGDVPIWLAPLSNVYEASDTYSAPANMEGAW
ncbi:hypothetical protein QFZ94_008353 [Paraburkholderia sp. JPY465]